jgi:hypothetical protein
MEVVVPSCEQSMSPELDSRNGIDNLLQVAAALEPQKTANRVSGSFVGQDADQIRRLRRKLLSREYSRRYRMRIREKIGMMKFQSPGAHDSPSLDSSPPPPQPQPAHSAPVDAAERIATGFLQQIGSSGVVDDWERFVQSVQRLSVTSEGRKCVIMLASKLEG